jgi:hypothetical protein
MISVTAEDINTLFVQTVSSNDSAVHMDWEANIRGGYSHREYVYSLTQLIVILIFIDSISKSHWTTWRCGVEKNKVRSSTN